jgi:hypothetical protein
MQIWTKVGLVFCPDGRHPLMRTHAAVPTAEHVGGDIYRVYFCARDEQSRARTFSLVLDLNRPLQPLDVSEEPLFDLGELGAFDDSGAMLTWITDAPDGSQYYYYSGWNLGITVPFRNALGVALARNGRIVKRYPGPVIDRNLNEPHFVGNIAVLHERGTYRGWYLSCVRWEPAQPRPIHRYHIKYATSADGLNWQRDGVVAIDFAGPHEVAIARPTILRDPDCYKMWYCYRGERYRIGYAESADGIVWTRMDDTVAFSGPRSAWDDASTAYPHVFDHGGTRFMLYNGNDYGRTGFGLAILAQDRTT